MKKQERAWRALDDDSLVGRGFRAPVVVEVVVDEEEEEEEEKEEEEEEEQEG